MSADPSSAIRVPAMPAAARAELVNVLEEDPELAEALEGERLRAAVAHARAAAVEVPRGEWRGERWPERLRRGPGLLILGGLMLRRVGLQGRFGAELLAPGDLLRPWQREDAVVSVPRLSDWLVLKSVRVALLDLGFAVQVAPYPEVQVQLIARAMRRARNLAINMAIVHQPRVESRLRMVLWHLADRLGRVRSDGVIMPVRLTHAVLAELVAARRPTVSAALSALERAGEIARTRDGWLLLGSPPGELRELSAEEI